MLNTLLLTLGSAALHSPTLPDPLPLVQDDPKDLPDKRPEVKELVGTLKDHAKKRGKEDAEAIATVKQLEAEFGKSGLKDRATIAKDVGNVLKEKRKEVDGVTDNKLFLQCATALGSMGPESSKVLQSWIGHKNHKKDVELQERLILALGKTKDEKAVKALLDLLSHHEARIQGAAGTALGNYAHLDQKVRKDIFEEVLKALTGVYNRMQGDTQDIIARERYDVIAAPMTTTLQVLSKHDERKPPDWRHWWNKNKKADWDKEG
jgi:hypothetical protein